MKSTSFLVIALAAAMAFFLPRTAQAQARDEVSFDFFYDSLAPYGEWVDVGDYGTCWRPNDVDADWAPYSDGYWAFTDAGWTWVSYEDFGGIVYHYGRWIRLEGEGWCWQPDYEWGPAWVSWRQSDDYVGWAPLPPEARWRPETGISIWVDRVCDIGPGNYNFCRVNDFGAPALRPVIVNRYENVTIIRRTTNITNITYNTGYGDSRVVYNGGLNLAFVNEHSAHPIPALKLVQRTNFAPADWRDRQRGNRPGFLNAQAQGNQLVVIAPRVAAPVDPAFLKSRIKRTFTADKVSRGWSGVKDPGVRQQVQQEIARQSRGLTPESAPAKPVQAAELKAVPTKGDPSAPSPVTAGHNRPDRRDGTPNNTPASTANTNRPTPQSATPNNAPTAATATPSASPREGGRNPRDRGQDRPTAAGSTPSNQPGQPLRPFNAPNSQSQTPAAASTSPESNRPANPTTDNNPGRNRDRGDRGRNQPAAVTQNPDATPSATPGRNSTPRGPSSAETAGRQRNPQSSPNPAAQGSSAADQERVARQRAAQAGQQQAQEAQQRQQADQDRVARQRQAEAAAQQKQGEAQQQQQRAAQAQEAARAQGAERARQQAKEAEARRNQPPADQSPRRQPESQRPPSPENRRPESGQAPSGSPNPGNAHRPKGGEKDSDKDKKDNGNQ